jgi:hypothetical protein
MTPFDRFLDAFGDRLADASANRSARLRRRRSLVFIGALPAGTVVAVVALLVSSGRQLDPVAEARAALAPPGEIVYMKITSTLIAPKTSHPTPPQTTEQWSATDPPRWRFVQRIQPGREEFAYAHGAQSYYNADRDRLQVRTGYSDRGPGARVPSLLGLGSGDVQADLRSMLAGGKVTDMGTARVGGRTVRRLVSERLQGQHFRTRLIYDVDPRSFAPVQATLSTTFPHMHFVTRMHIDDYKRIPLNARTVALLQIRDECHHPDACGGPQAPAGEVRAAEERPQGLSPPAGGDARSVTAPRSHRSFCTPADRRRRVPAGGRRRLQQEVDAMSNAADWEDKLQENPLLSRLVREAGMDDAITFWGYIGPSSDENTISLHPSLESPHGSVEIAKKDIVHVEDVPENILLFGAKVVWVRRDAAIARRGAEPAVTLGKMKRADTIDPASVPAPNLEEVQVGRLRMNVKTLASDPDCHSPCATCRDCSSVCICICRYTDPPA